MITLPKLLSFFPLNDNETYRTFITNATVKIGTKTESLRAYAKRKNICLEDLKLLYENIKERNIYLSRFYNTSLYVPDDLTIRELPMKSKHMNNNLKVQYKNIIRNLFFWEILHNTKSGIENNPSFLYVLDQLYNHCVIDYKILTPSAIHYLKEGRLGSVFSSFYFRASIMNPYLVFSMNKSILHGKRIFTPTLGWGSYFYGMAESGMTNYVGTDVIPSVCKGVRQFAKKYYSDINTTIFCSPSEKLAIDNDFLNKYRKSFDVVFFSPPYYQLELYEGSQQSTTKYKTYEEWLDQYWKATMKLCWEVLEPDGIMCYILSGYGSKNTSGEYDLLKDMNTIAQQFFILKGKQPMYNKNVHVTNHRETAEQIMLFRKK